MKKNKVFCFLGGLFTGCVLTLTAASLIPEDFIKSKVKPY